MNALAYRKDMIASTLGAYGWLFVTILFLNVIYKGAGTIGGWTFAETMVILGTGQLIFNAYWMFTPGAGSTLIDLVRKGSLDRFLLRPINAWFSVSIDGSNVFMLIPSLIAAIFILVYGCTKSQINPSSFDILMYCIALVLGFFITWFTYLAVSSVSFYFTDIEGFLGFLSNLGELQKYPGTIYTGAARFVFLILIPIGIIAYTPASFLVKGFSISLMTIQIVAAIWVTTAFKFLWKYEIKNYSSASS
jgi:ABC-2 type transport system permease protein